MGHRMIERTPDTSGDQDGALSAEARSRAEQRAAARAARIARRRSQVIEAASRLMYRTGYHGMSMHAVADEAGFSVGLIYQYFGSKEEILRDVIVDILHAFRYDMPRAMDAAGSEPEARLRAGFASYCRTIASKREATLLAYRETPTLSSEAAREVMRLESETLAPLRDVVAEGIAQGVFRPVSPDLVTHNLKMVAHGWALKYWDLAPKTTLDGYIESELDLLFAALRAPTEPTAHGDQPAQRSDPAGRPAQPVIDDLAG